jgi:hypothetical protein
MAAAATDSRDSSTARRAARPAECNDEALPVRASAALIAATASGSIGVVAAPTGRGHSQVAEQRPQAISCQRSGSSYER